MILDKIVAYKREEVRITQQKVPLSVLQNGVQPRETRSFAQALRKSGDVTLIAEIKKASPSKGLIRVDFNPGEIAKIYSESGASAISVLTDREFFQGSPEYLTTARDLGSLPVLRKDFVIDPYQIYEAKYLGADALLLIMAILTDREVTEFQKIASDLGLQCLVEVHTEKELERALKAGATIIGINNRDLQTFKTELDTTFRLRQLVTDPDVTVVSESGINTRSDVIKLRENGVHAMLVGEALMRETDISAKIAELLGK